MRRCQALKSRRGARAVAGVLPDDLYDYIDADADEPAAPAAAPAAATSRHPIAPVTRDWTVSDDWPERVPVTEAEIDLFEAWFGDILDELFGKSV